MVAVESSNIKAIGYDKPTRKLRIQFKSGLYEYVNVEKQLFDGFLEAESKGKFFQQHKPFLTQYVKIS
jgi:hypothetical protein